MRQPAPQPGGALWADACFGQPMVACLPYPVQTPEPPVLRSASLAGQLRGRAGRPEAVPVPLAALPRLDGLIAMRQGSWLLSCPANHPTETAAQNNTLWSACDILYIFVGVVQYDWVSRRHRCAQSKPEAIVRGSFLSMNVSTAAFVNLMHGSVCARAVAQVFDPLTLLPIALHSAADESATSAPRRKEHTCNHRVDSGLPLTQMLWVAS